MTNVEALRRLDAFTRRLRRECPWDREQDERSIVPHTVEEAYELADGRARRRRREAARRARRRPLPGALPVAAARGARRRRAGRGRRALPPEADPPPPARLRRGRGRDGRARCCATGTRSRPTEPGREPGIFGEVPENLPGPLYARKVQRRAATSGFDFAARALRGASRASSRSCATPRGPRAAFHEVGDVLFAAVNVARKLKVDPELALRAAAERFRGARGGGQRPGRSATAPIGRIWSPTRSSPTTRERA